MATPLCLSKGHSMHELGQKRAQVAAVVINSRGLVESVNEAACRLSGYTQADLVGKNVNVLMDSPYREQHDSYIERYRQSGQPRVLGKSRVVELRHATAKIIKIRLTLSEVKQADETRFVGLLEPVLENKTTLRTDADGQVLEATGACEEMFGYTDAEFRSLNLSAIMPAQVGKEHTQLMRNYIARFISARKSNSPRDRGVLGRVRNFRCCHRSGASFAAALLADIVTYPDSDRIEFVGHIWKVDSSVEAVLTANSDGVVESVNEQFPVLFGYSAEDVQGKELASLLAEANTSLQRFYVQTVERFATDKTLPARLASLGVRHVYARHQDKSTFLVALSIDAFVQDERLMFRGIMSRAAQQVDTDDLPDGSMLGHYQLSKVLGKGYFGKVRRAVHKPTGELVAIKTLRRKQYEECKMRFPPREIEMLKRINHPNCAKLIDIIETPDRIHLVVENVSAGELFDYLATKNHFNEEECRFFFRQIVSAVLHIHAKGIAHRDLKLENCLIDKIGNVKIIDFGLGNFLPKDGQLLGTFCGSADYAAPELWKGKKYKGPEVDVWSLGVILYLMSTGYLPFGDAQAAISGRFHHPSHLSRSITNLIDGCLHIDPTRRMTMEQVRTHAWLSDGDADGPPPTLLADPRYTEEGVDREVLDSLTEFGFDPTKAWESVKRFETNEMTATYFLLKKKKDREQKMAAGCWFTKFQESNFAARKKSSFDMQTSVPSAQADEMDVTPPSSSSSSSSSSSGATAGDAKVLVKSASAEAKEAKCTIM